MKEEDILKTSFGKENPFRVPEGYFEALESRVMNNLPEEKASIRTVAKEIPLWRRFRPYVAAAAFFGVMVGGYLIYQKNNPEAPLPSENVASMMQSDDYNIDTAADYAMLDNEDFYAYLAGE